jgi:Mor family transcriptional regulator
MELLERLTLDDLVDEQRELAEIVGIEAYKELVRVYGGSRIYINKAETVLADIRDAEINRQYDGYNIRELCSKYNLSETTIRRIVSENPYKKRPGLIPGQKTMFD